LAAPYSLLTGAPHGAALLTWWPRLDVELSLRGTTRSGTLYARVHNRGRPTARGVRVRVEWIGPGGQAREVATVELGDIEGGSASLATIRDPQREVADAPAGWSALRAEARARNAFPARASLGLAARPAAEDPAAPVRYRRPEDLPCPDAADGRHRWRVDRVLNDGARESWHVCERCRLAWREPLSPVEEETQRRVRAERAERERRKLEEEWERAAAEPRPRRAPPPPREEADAMPAEVAFLILGLDPATATWDDVVRAHRRLALANHPDRARDAETRAANESRMAEINRARDRLRERLGS
jgi:hypothetical protein